MEDRNPALVALTESGIAHTVTRHGRVGSLAEAAAREVTGYERGTITPFGTRTPLPVVADERIVGQQISLGAGAHGAAATLAADDVVRHFGAQVADVTDPA